MGTILSVETLCFSRGGHKVSNFVLLSRDVLNPKPNLNDMLQL